MQNSPETKKGLVHGKTAEDAPGVKEKKDKVSPEDFFATMAYALGLPLDKRIHGSGGRPFFVGGQAKPIPGLFS